jgi:hypothetical protein
MKPRIGKNETKIVPATDGSPIKVLKPDLRFDLGPRNPLLAVRELIARHVGAANAITVQQIAEKLWHHQWWFSRQDPTNRAEYPHREEVQRRVKGLVSRLKRKEKNIGVCRGHRNDPPGYYLIANEDERRKSLLPYYDQAVSMLRTVHEQTGVDLFVPELMAKRRQLATLGTTPPEAPGANG